VPRGEDLKASLQGQPHHSHIAHEIQQLVAHELVRVAQPVSVQNAELVQHHGIVQVPPKGQAVGVQVLHLTPWHLVLTMVVALGVALGLFVVLPHFLSALMQWLGLSGDVESISFNAWDGLFKMLVFVGYIVIISFVPDIRRVFQYHGAEHKVIWSFENGDDLSVASARAKSRLHPRCGTSFLLFVLAVSILLHTALVPVLLKIYTPEIALVKHLYIVAAKLLFMIPVSCVAYEIIRFAGKFNSNVLCRMLCWPGLALQMLTTKEPDDSQIEVAMAALKCAVSEEACS